MYESPIELIQKEMQFQYEENCVKAVQQCGFNIDKDRLAAALRFDKLQYDKGYSEGIRDYIEAISNIDFLFANYGISDIDIRFITSFNPKTVIENYNEWKTEKGLLD